MKIEYDSEVDALYLSIQAGAIAKTLERSDNVTVDVDEEGQVLGLEILNISSIRDRGSFVLDTSTPVI